MNAPTIYDPSVTCKVQDHTFSQAEVAKYWNYSSYGDCSPKVKASISIEDNILYAQCENGQTPLIHLESKTPELLGGQIENPSWIQNDFILLGTAQYVLVMCDTHSIYPVVFNRINQEVSRKSKILTNSISDSSKPLAVLLLVFDSISKDSASRNLKTTLNYLKHTVPAKFNNKYSVYDFNLANAAGGTTRENMVQMLYGQNINYHEEILRGSVIFDEKYLELQKDSLWSYFSSLGYVTYFSVDTVYDYLVESTGRVITADHVFTNFWKIAKKVYGYTDHLEGQRCLGDHNAHFYSMNYTYQFLNNYRNHHRFGYAHITAAHEETGNVLTVDKDLQYFLENTFRLFDSDEEDLVIFLLADHGKHMKELEYSPKGQLESMMPMTFVVMNTELEQKIGSKDKMQHNVNRLMSRYDINFSLKALAFEPYGGYGQFSYERFKNKYPVADAVSIFHEKISDKRKCVEIGVQEDDCICKDYAIVNLNDKTEKKIFDEAMVLVRMYIGNEQEECEDMNVFSISSAKKIQNKTVRGGWNSFYLYRVVMQSGNVLLTSAVFSTYSKAVENNYILEESPAIYSVFTVDNGIEVFVKVTEIRLEGPCNPSPCIVDCYPEPAREND